MSTYIDLDSTYRNKITYTNPAQYVVEDAQVSTWPRAPRTVTAMSNRASSKVLEFGQSVRIKEFILPAGEIQYSAPDPTPGQEGKFILITTNTIDLQRIYLDVHTLQYDGVQLVCSIENKIPKAKFVLTQSRIQYDSLGFATFVHFHCNMDQVMRFSRNESVVINIMQEQGSTIIIDDTDPVTFLKKQTYILLEVTPYFRDGEFSNHGLGLTQF